MSTPTANDRLDFIDALRGIAILGVMAVHCYLMTSPDGPVGFMAQSGQRGVQLFYIVSAFTLCASLDARSEPISNYFLRRFFRIAPLFYFAVLINLALRFISPELSSQRDLPASSVLLGVLFLNGLQPLAINGVIAGGWSIAVETTFYAILPKLHARFNSALRTAILFLVSAPVLFLVCTKLAYAAKDSAHSEYFGFMWFPVEFPVFVLGMFAYQFWKNYIRGKTDVTLSALLLAASALLYGTLTTRNRSLYGSSLYLLGFVLALSLCPWGYFVNRVTRYLGRISYSLYILHFFLLPVVAASKWGFFGHLALLVAIAVPVAEISYRVIERPGIALGSRIIKRQSNRLQIASSESAA